MTANQRLWIAALALAACCFSTLAFAELPPVDPETRRDILFQVLGEIARRVTGWEAQVTSAASYLFWTLGTISLTWTMGMMILKRADLGEFFAEFIRFIFFFGLFFALLRQGPEVAKLILQSMLQLGQQTAGSTIEYRTFIDIGMELMSRADQFQQTGASREDSFLVTGLCAAILLMLTTMVINLVLVFVAGWFLMYAGIFFLGFGGARWTSDIAIGYYKAVIAIGIQMFVMALIMGIATDVLGGFFDQFSFEMRFYELMTFLVATFAFLTIFNRIPPLLSGLISGANIGISQGELSGAVRGANGADPFSTGRLAIGTAAGGAQKLFAAMARGSDSTKAAGQIPQITKTPDQPIARGGTVAAAMTPAQKIAGSPSGETLANNNPMGTPTAAESSESPVFPVINPTRPAAGSSDSETMGGSAAAREVATTAKEAQVASPTSPGATVSPELRDANTIPQNQTGGASGASQTTTLIASPSPATLSSEGSPQGGKAKPSASESRSEPTSPPPATNGRNLQRTAAVKPAESEPQSFSGLP